MGPIVLTGAGGFIGRNVMLRLGELDMPVASIDHTLRGTALAQALAGASVVLHLAGVNRPTEVAEFATGNAGMTEALVQALETVGGRIPVIYASSIRAAEDTAYGVSKRRAEESLRQYGERLGADVHLLRLPNVFGKWSRPNYNSVVATFCHNIARDLPIAISNPAAALELLYIDDLIEILIALIRNPSLTSEGILQPVYKTTVGELAQHLTAFRNSRTSLVTGPVGTGYLRALHATYLSFLEPSQFAYDLKAHTDPRGTFAEMLRTHDAGQFSYFTAHPGVTRGGHYHHSKTEKFLVVEGHAVFGFRNVLTGERATIEVTGSDARVVETVPGWAHDITNIGTGTMVVLLWANEVFDPNRPDTVPSKVIP